MPKPQPRPGLLEITPYTPGKSKLAGRKVHKLSSNESALGASAKALAAYADAAQTLERYPDGTALALKEAIGEVHSLKPERLIVGAGSDEIIQMLIRAYAGPGETICQTRHGFSYYWIAAKAAGVETVFAEETDLRADPEKILNTVRDDTKILFLANPNNPTGTVLWADELRDLRARLREDVLLVIDGAYSEYMDDPRYTDGRDLVDEAIASGADNVVMMRTFSKIHGLGGLRIGWAYGPDEVISILDRVRGPFNVSGPGIVAAAAAIRDRAFVEENRRYNTQMRDRVTGALRQQGFVVGENHANFVLFGMAEGDGADGEKAAHDLLLFLEERGVLIRAAASGNLPAYLRVSIGDTEAMEAFLDGIAEYRAAT